MIIIFHLNILIRFVILKKKRMTQLDSKEFKLKDIEMDSKFTKGTSKEKKETKWDKIDWNKLYSEEKRECKWNNIDWSKPYSEAKKESKWDKIDWSRDYSSEEKKIKEYKNEVINDNMMTGEDFNEKITDEKEVDLSWLKGLDGNISNDDYNKKDYEGRYETLKNDENDDLNWLKDFDENIRKDKYDVEKDFVIDDFDAGVLNDLNFKEEIYHDDEREEFQIVYEKKMEKFDEKKIKDFKNQSNDELQEKIKSYQEYDLEKSKGDLDKINECLKQVNWTDISKDWKIQVYAGKGYKSITLNPSQDCSKSNPLYKHEKWLKWVYTNKDLNLNDQSIAKICDNISNKTIGNWRARFDIETKEIANYIKDGYRFLYMQKEYKHPKFNPIGDKRIYRQEHIVKMEKHLNNVLTSEELSQHPCLVENDGKYYIENGSVVHHINHNRLDNRIENLWLYKNDMEHKNSNINECLSGLIKLNQVSFSDGNYCLNHDYDYRYLNRDKINEVLEKKSLDNYENLNKVKETIKNMDWSGMDWNIEYKLRNFAPIEKIQLNPKEDCSEKNPLYRHKGWVERIVRDKRFNLTDSRLCELCGISERTARRYRKEKYNIPAEYRGFDRYMGKNSSDKNIIFKKVDKSYGNPFAVEKANSIQMREHRYIMEKHLAREPKLNKDYLINGKYLKPNCPVHHINLDKLDNRLENLYPCNNCSEHNKIHSSLIKLIDEMMKSSLIIFKNGKYVLDN